MPAPQLPQHFHESIPERISHEVATGISLLLMGTLWLAAGLVGTTLLHGSPALASAWAPDILHSPQSLPIATRFPALGILVPQTASTGSQKSDDLQLVEHHAAHVAGALVGDEVQSVLLRLQLVAETATLMSNLAHNR